MLALLVLSILLSKAIVRAITGLTGKMTRLAGNDFDVDLGEVDRKDEIGEMGRSVVVFRENGLEALFGRYERLAKGTRAAALALGLELYPDESCISNVLTAIKLPDSIDGSKVVKIMRDTHGISIAGGQAQLKGKIIRIAHMGCLVEEDMIHGLEVFEKVLKEMGHKFPDQAGVNAAKEVYGLTINA